MRQLRKYFIVAFFALVIALCFFIERPLAQSISASSGGGGIGSSDLNDVCTNGCTTTGLDMAINSGNLDVDGILYGDSFRVVAGSTTTVYVSSDGNVASFDAWDYHNAYRRARLRGGIEGDPQSNPSLQLSSTDVLTAANLVCVTDESQVFNKYACYFGSDYFTAAFNTQIGNDIFAMFDAAGNTPVIVAHTDIPAIAVEAGIVVSDIANDSPFFHVDPDTALTNWSSPASGNVTVSIVGSTGAVYATSVFGPLSVNGAARKFTLSGSALTLKKTANGTAGAILSGATSGSLTLSDEAGDTSTILLAGVNGIGTFQDPNGNGDVTISPTATSSFTLDLELASNLQINGVGKRMIMTSPDGSCSSCGPDNSDTFACAALAACP